MDGGWVSPIGFWHTTHHLNWTCVFIKSFFFLLLGLRESLLLLFHHFFFFCFVFDDSFCLRQCPCNLTIVQCELYAVRASFLSSHGPGVQINLFMAIGNALFAFWSTFPVNALFDMFTTRCHSCLYVFFFCSFASIL